MYLMKTERKYATSITTLRNADGLYSGLSLAKLVRGGAHRRNCAAAAWPGDSDALRDARVLAYINGESFSEEALPRCG